MNPGDGVLRGGECHGCDVIGRLPQPTRSSHGTVSFYFLINFEVTQIYIYANGNKQELYSMNLSIIDLRLVFLPSLGGWVVAWSFC